MLKIKPFLLSLCLSPLSLTALQLPVNAQNRSPSVGTAGSQSGVVTTVTGSPSVRTSGSQSGVVTTVTVVQPNVAAGGATTATVSPAVNSAANLVISTSTSSTTITLISSAAPLAPISTAALTAAATAAPTPGSSSSVSTPNGPASLTAPTATSAGAVTVGGVTVAIPASANAANAAVAATAVLAAGGTPSQAATAAAIAGTGISPALAVALVSALSLILSADSTASADLRPNLNASLLKSFDSGKDLLLAQGKSGSINPTQLALAINAYNEIVDTSTPEAFAELSKSKDFMEIGQTLRKLRAAFGD